MIRADYIFSYWIFLWYVLYMTGLVHHNPKFALYLGVIEHLLFAGSMIYYNVSVKNVVYFMVIFVVLKAIPLWTIHHTPVKQSDIHAFLGILLMYIGWIVWDEKLEALVTSYRQLLNNQNELPGMALLERWFR